MAYDPSELLKEAFKLPPEVRAAIAGSLLASLDQEVDEASESAWAEEIARRVNDLDSGRIKPIPWAEAKRRIAGQ